MHVNEVVILVPVGGNWVISSDYVKLSLFSMQPEIDIVWIIHDEYIPASSPILILPPPHAAVGSVPFQSCTHYHSHLPDPCLPQVPGHPVPPNTPATSDFPTTHCRICTGSVKTPLKLLGTFSVEIWYHKQRNEFASAVNFPPVICPWLP